MGGRDIGSASESEWMPLRRRSSKNLHPSRLRHQSQTERETGRKADNDPKTDKRMGYIIEDNDRGDEEQRRDHCANDIEDVEEHAIRVVADS